MDPVFASNNQMVLGVLHQGYQYDIRVPEDLAVVGFDDLPEASYFTPSLTTVRHPLRETGMLAVTSLLAHIETGEQSPPDRMVTLQTELVVRDSTLVPRHSESVRRTVLKC